MQMHTYANDHSSHSAYIDGNVNSMVDLDSNYNAHTSSDDRHHQNTSSINIVGEDDREPTHIPIVDPHILRMCVMSPSCLLGSVMLNMELVIGSDRWGNTVWVSKFACMHVLGER